VTRPGERVKIFFDGGLRPEGMEYALVCRGERRVRQGLGPGTSMTAEWLALLAATHWALALGEPAVLVGDSAAVIAQARGRVPARGDHAAHLTEWRALVANGPRPALRQVKRAQNLAGIALDRLPGR